MAISKLTIVKFIEMALTFACVGLHYSTCCRGDIHTILIPSGTFIGFSIILIALSAGYLMNTPINKRLDIFFSLVGCALFVASGALIIEAWQNGRSNRDRDLALTMGSFSVINGAVFLIDVILTFRGTFIWPHSDIASAQTRSGGTTVRYEFKSVQKSSNRV